MKNLLKRFSKKSNEVTADRVSDFSNPEIQLEGKSNESIPEVIEKEPSGIFNAPNLKTARQLLLLLLGIFLAFMANNWWQNKNLRKTEHFYLQNFHRDVSEDSKHLKHSIAVNSSRIIDVESILGDLYKNPDSVDLNNFNNRYISAIFASTFQPVQSTFSDLINSSNTEVLYSQQLKNNIFRYYESIDQGIEEIKENQKFHRETFVEHFNANYVQGKSLVIFQRYYENIDQESDPNLTLWKFRKNSAEFIQAENLILQRLLFLERTLDIEETLLKKANELKKDLTKELERFDDQPGELPS